jgi:hypothetical protein
MRVSADPHDLGVARALTVAIYLECVAVRVPRPIGRDQPSQWLLQRGEIGRLDAYDDPGRGMDADQFRERFRADGMGDLPLLR